MKDWERELDVLHARLGALFRRSEPRERSLSYLKGLLSAVQRKNGWQLAEWMGEATPDGVQHLLERASWDADAARDVLREYVVEHLGDDDGVLIVDETGFIKKGEHSAAYSASTAAPPDGSRTARSGGSCATRGEAAAPSSIEGCISRVNGATTGHAARRRASQRMWSSPLSRKWRARC